MMPLKYPSPHLSCFWYVSVTSSTDIVVVLTELVLQESCTANPTRAINWCPSKSCLLIFQDVSVGFRVVGKSESCMTAVGIGSAAALQCRVLAPADNQVPPVRTVSASTVLDFLKISAPKVPVPTYQSRSQRASGLMQLASAVRVLCVAPGALCPRTCPELTFPQHGLWGPPAPIAYGPACPNDYTLVRSRDSKALICTQLHQFQTMSL